MRLFSQTYRVVLGLCVAVLVTGIANADNINIEYKGRLQNAAGADLTGTVAMEIRLFETPTGGLPEEAVWGEIHVSVKIETDGSFALIIGQGVTLGVRDIDLKIVTLVDVLDGRSIFIELAPIVNNEPRPITPRQPVLYTPYAAFAARASTARLAEKLAVQPGAPAQVPPGAIVAFAGSLAKAEALADKGWLYCDGRTVDFARDLNGDPSIIFAPLFDAIGRQWGAPFSATDTEFSIPDLRGVFLRGALGSRVVSPNAIFWGEFADEDRELAGPLATGPVNTVGSFQKGAFLKHTHAQTDFDFLLRKDGKDTWDGGDNTVGEPSASASIPMNKGVYSSSVFPFRNALNDGVATLLGENLALETVPQNIAVHYLIKY